MHPTVCCIKFETNGFVLEWRHVAKNDPLLFGFTDLLLSFCFDGISKKRKNALLSGALQGFCLVCEIFLRTTFQTFLRRDFVTALYLVSFFCHQAIFIHSLPHPQPNIFVWKKLGHIWCADTIDLLGQKFQTQHPAVCSLLLPLL